MRKKRSLKKASWIWTNCRMADPPSCNIQLLRMSATTTTRDTVPTLAFNVAGQTGCIPTIGLGTATIKGEACIAACQTALEMGYVACVNFADFWSVNVVLHPHSLTLYPAAAAWEHFECVGAIVILILRHIEGQFNGDRLDSYSADVPNPTLSGTGCWIRHCSTETKKLWALVCESLGSHGTMFGSPPRSLSFQVIRRVAGCGTPRTSKATRR
jgi:hypothetical protein